MPKKVKRTGSECVKVIIRVRPLNQKEKNNKSTFILDIVKERGEITIKKPKNKNRSG